MTKYFSATAGAFFTPDVHGPRLIDVPDPTWQRPMIDVPNPEWVPTAEASTEDEASKVPPLISVPDWSVQQPTISVDNPDCKIPPDAVEITDEAYAALMAEQSAGKRISVGANGFPEAVDPPPLSAEQRVAQISAVVQRHLDDAARAMGYDDVRSAISYADEPVVPKYQGEGQAFRKWRSLVWDVCTGVLADVLSNKRSAPTEAELLAELPKLELP